MLFLFRARARLFPFRFVALWAFLLFLGSQLQADPLYFDEGLVQERVEKMQNEAVKPRYSREVMSYVRTYMLLHRAHAQLIVGRTVLYFPLFEKLLQEQGLPTDLKYLAIVESALDPKAISVVGAKGLWQFMPSTGKLYGLHIGRHIDERCDPEKATRAAIRYLQDAHNRFGSWELAIAAYNSGPGRVSRAIKRGRSKDFWRIRRFLPRETRNYVPAFIGAQYLMEYHEEHELQPRYPHLDLQLTGTLQVEHALSFLEIAQVTGIPLDWLEWLNPAFQLGYLPYHPRGQTLVLPRRHLSVMERYLAQKSERPFWGDDLLGRPVQLAQRRETYTLTEGKYRRTYHEVKAGDDLAGLARKFNLSRYQIRVWNRLRSDTLQEGTRLLIYQPAEGESFPEWRFLSPVDPLPRRALTDRKLSSLAPRPAPPFEPSCIWLPVDGKFRLSALSRQYPTLSIKDFRERNRLPKEGDKVRTDRPLCLCAEDLE